MGGGAGGLSSAGRLANANCTVTLLEKNDALGGRVQSQHVEGGWRFDTGPSLLLFPQKYRDTFEALGYPNMEDLGVEIRRIDPAYRIFFPATPSFQVDMLADVDDMATQLEALERGAGAAYKRFLAMTRANLELGMPNFIERDFSELKNARNLMDLLPSLKNLNPWALLGQHDLVMKGYFKDARLRAAFTFQDLYVGLSPTSAPAVFSLLAGTELTDGVWYPIGGFGGVRDGLTTAAERCGVSIRTGATVATIDVSEKTTAAAAAAGGGGGHQVVGVTLVSGEFLPADVVVCNKDLPAAYRTLFSSATSSAATSSKIGEYIRKKAESLAQLKYSNGVIAFNWAIKGKLPQLLHHNVFLSDQFAKAWTPARAATDFPQFPNFYCHVPSKTDASAAPEGCESVMVLLPVGNMQPDLKNKKKSGGGATGIEDYAELVAAGRQRVFDCFSAAGVGDIEGMIHHEFVITPPQWEERYGVQFGAAFGLSHGLNQLSIFRPQNRDEMIKGLYFVGASTTPGNGVPLCLIGAKLTAERILKDYQLLA